LTENVDRRLRRRPRATLRGAARPGDVRPGRPAPRCRPARATSSG